MSSRGRNQTAESSGVGDAVPEMNAALRVPSSVSGPILARVGDGLLLLTCDADGTVRVAYASPAIAERLRRAPADLAGERPAWLTVGPSGIDVATALERGDLTDGSCCEVSAGHGLATYQAPWGHSCEFDW